jgi:hypothetical protein
MRQVIFISLGLAIGIGLMRDGRLEIKQDTKHGAS